MSMPPNTVVEPSIPNGPKHRQISVPVGTPCRVILRPDWDAEVNWTTIVGIQTPVPPFLTFGFVREVLLSAHDLRNFDEETETEIAYYDGQP